MIHSCTQDEAAMAVSPSTARNLNHMVPLLAATGDVVAMSTSSQIHILLLFHLSPRA
jgi:hypothetical protein